MALFLMTLSDLKLPTNHPIIDILYRLSYLRSGCLGLETSHFVGRLIVASASRRMTNHPWKGRGQVT